MFPTYDPVIPWSLKGAVTGAISARRCRGTGTAEASQDPAAGNDQSGAQTSVQVQWGRRGSKRRAEGWLYGGVVCWKNLEDVSDMIMIYDYIHILI